MNLRTKAIVILFATFISLLFFFYFSIRQIVLREHEELEEVTVQQNIRRALNRIQDEIDAISTINNDWACWDDTYNFILDTNEQFVADNLMDETFSGLQINLMTFQNLSGEMVEARTFELEEKKSAPLSARWASRLQNVGKLLDQTLDIHEVSGLLDIDGECLLISARSILTSVNQGPSHGCLIMGRLLDRQKIERFRKNTDLDLDFASPADPALEPDFREARTHILQFPKATTSQEPVQWLQILDDHTIAGYALLTDLFGKPILLMRIAMPRAIYQSAQSALNYVLLSLLGIGLVFGLLILHLWQQHVLSRLRMLSEQVSRIGALGDLAAQVQVSGHDELSVLSENFNRMLRALKQASVALQESELRYRSFVQHFQGIAFRFSLDMKLLFVHGAIERITGYSEQELAGEAPRWADLIFEEDRPAFSELRSRVFSTPGLKMERQYRIRRKDGSMRWIQELIQNVRDDRGVPVYIQSTAYNITAGKQAELDLQQSRDELIRLSAHLQAIREEERTRIACKIHDDLGQLLMALKIDVSSMSKKIRSNPEEADRRANSAKETVDRIMAAVQTISLELKPSVLDALGISDALEWQANEFRKLTGLECALHVDPPDLPTSKAIATTVFRVTQEALSNIVRHAGARRVEIRLEQKDANLLLTLHDDGRGIRPDEIQSLNSFGLIQMKERILAHNGSFSIEGLPGKGTTVHITLRLEPEPAPKETS
ncbi:MAG TPA: hypothetical protein DCZ95_07710 [Verrucomicrobia bacterium]|nr:MAG: hypothetical protein A2X46_01105 [Lentisphaerae bacterium GWF2_57_35]HBA83961.1 hypothetical protein [Verrucomicrobiota bacterium]